MLRLEISPTSLVAVTIEVIEMAIISAVMEVSLALRPVKASRIVRADTIVRAVKVVAITVVREARAVRAVTIVKAVRGAITVVPVDITVREAKVVRAAIIAREAKVVRVDLTVVQDAQVLVVPAPVDLAEALLLPWRSQRRFLPKRLSRERSLYTARIEKRKTSLKIEIRRKSRPLLPVPFQHPSRLWRQSPYLIWQRR
jgi:ABC-type uncharacterized transport system ATPase component